MEGMRASPVCPGEALMRSGYGCLGVCGVRDMKGTEWVSGKEALRDARSHGAQLRNEGNFSSCLFTRRESDFG